MTTKKLLGTGPNQIPTNSMLGDLAFQGKDASLEGVKIDAGNRQVTYGGRNVWLSSADGDWADGGLVLETPVYNEYQYVFPYDMSREILLTCSSYFCAEVTFIQSQSNGGGVNNRYWKAFWNNNHTTHRLDIISDIGGIGSYSTTFVTGDDGSGSTNTGKLLITETWDGNGAVYASRMIVRHYKHAGEFGITVNEI
jgi:hypothetical protein